MTNRTLDELQRAVIAFRDERDWAQFHHPRQLTAALAIEAAELQEQLLWLSDEEVTAKLNSPTGREAFEDELADVFAYLLCLAEASATPLAQALERKLEKNRAKYPVELVRGKADKYTTYRIAPENKPNKKTNNSR